MISIFVVHYYYSLAKIKYQFILHKQQGVLEEYHCPVNHEVQ